MFFTYLSECCEFLWSHGSYFFVNTIFTFAIFLRGLLARSIIQAQAFSPAYSNVYAALVAVINSKFPHIGELILRRLIVQFKRSFRRNDKATTVTVTKFLAHLVNQQVVR